VACAAAAFALAESFCWENLVLRQQLVVLKQRKRRLKLDRVAELFWVVVQRVWTEWSKSLLIVTPETVVRWHRAGFRRYWHWRSQREISYGRRHISREVRGLIFQMVAQNPTWGASRVHGEAAEAWIFCV
jgi:putative transposase